jgi:hypothetical protein
MKRLEAAAVFGFVIFAVALMLLAALKAVGKPCSAMR